MDGAALGTLKVCPECAEEVKAAARLCRFCGYRFDEQQSPERSPEQDSTIRRTGPPKVGQNVELSGAYLNGQGRWEYGRWLLLMDDGVAISGDREASFGERWGQIEAINVDGPDAIQKRVTVPRVLLLGIVAFAVKKDDSRSFVSIETVDGKVSLFQVRGTVPEVRAAIAPFRAVLEHHRQARGC